MQNVEALKNQQQIIKSFIANFHLFTNYHYPILHYREVFFMIEQSNFGSILDRPKPLKTLKSDKKFQPTGKPSKNHISTLLLRNLSERF